MNGVHGLSTGATAPLSRPGRQRLPGRAGSLAGQECLISAGLDGARYWD